jgi:hypothetical protein
MAEQGQIRQGDSTFGVPKDTARRWREQGFLRVAKLPHSMRRFRGEDRAAHGEQTVGAFAPLREDDDVVVVSRSRSVD